MLSKRESFGGNFVLGTLSLLLLQVAFYLVILYVHLEAKIDTSFIKIAVSIGLLSLVALYFKQFKKYLLSVRLSSVFFLPFLLFYIVSCILMIYLHAIPSYASLSLSDGYIHAIEHGRTLKVIALQASTLWGLILCSLLSTVLLALLIKSKHKRLYI